MSLSDILQQGASANYLWAKRAKKTTARTQRQWLTAQCKFIDWVAVAHSYSSNSSWSCCCHRGRWEHREQTGVVVQVQHLATFAQQIAADGDTQNQYGNGHEQTDVHGDVARLLNVRCRNHLFCFFDVLDQWQRKRKRDTRNEFAFLFMTNGFHEIWTYLHFFVENICWPTIDAVISA